MESTSPNAAPPSESLEEFRVAASFGSVRQQLRGGHSPARLYLVESDCRGPVVVKVSSSGEPGGAVKLVAEAKQLTWLSERFRNYPRVIASGILGHAAYLVIPYFGRQTLAAKTDNLPREPASGAWLLTGF
jgi:aminoglycoside phosphotransferase